MHLVKDSSSKNVIRDVFSLKMGHPGPTEAVLMTKQVLLPQKHALWLYLVHVNVLFYIVKTMR